jgi:Protein of unknown function (DUF1194)
VTLARLRVVFAVLLLLSLGFGAAVAHAQTAVDLQLVLAVDASGSVDDTRFELQKQGYAAAFRNPEVVNAIMSGGEQAIGVTMMQWTGPFMNAQVVPWTLIKDAASAKAFGDAIARSERELYGGGTSISGAIDQSIALLSKSPFTSTRRTIDISGDGANTSGRSVAKARDDAVAQGIVINGLPILSIDPYLDRHYETQVIGGPGAFMIPAASYENFAEAVVKKLLQEIAANRPATKAGTVLAGAP